MTFREKKNTYDTMERIGIEWLFLFCAICNMEKNWSQSILKGTL